MKILRKDFPLPVVHTMKVRLDQDPMTVEFEAAVMGERKSFSFSLADQPQLADKIRTFVTNKLPVNVLAPDATEVDVADKE